MTLKRSYFRFFAILRNAVVGIFLAHLLYTVMLRWVNPPITVTQLGSVISGHGLRRDMIDIEKMSGDALLAVIAAEDQLFPDHNGFDIKSIENAISQHQAGRVRIRGASTISQQVAKNVFLWQGRSWIRKGLEAYCTFAIELIWGKKRILEMYMNVAEMGPGIFGVEAAAQQYFQKPAINLTRTEAARIAACLPNPKQYSVNPPSGYVTRRSQWILTQMNNLRTDPNIEQLINSDESEARKNTK